MWTEIGGSLMYQRHFVRLDKAIADAGIRNAVRPHSHASVPTSTDQVTCVPYGAASAAKARSAVTNCDTGWLRTIGWIQCGNCCAGWTPVDSNPKINGGRISNGVIAAGLRLPVPTRSAPKDSIDPIATTSSTKAAVYPADWWNRNPIT